MKLGKRWVALALSCLLTLCLLPGTAEAVGTPAVSAQGAIVMDGNSGAVYFEKDCDTPRPAASMTKIMSAYLVFQEIAGGTLSLDTCITPCAQAVALSNNPAYSGLERLRSGGSYTVRQLLGLIFTASCNGSVVALAGHISGSEEAFVARMNQQAADWGLTAHFADCTGFIDEGNAVTPRAMAEIARKLIADYPQVLEFSSLKSLVFGGKTFHSTNRMLRNDSYVGIDGLKSGTTNGAGRCYTGTAQRDGRRVISVAMRCQNDDSRVADTRKLLDYGFSCQGEADRLLEENRGAATVDFTWGDAPLYCTTTRTVTATLGGFTAAYDCTAQWTVSGTPVGDPVSLKACNGTALSLDCPLPLGTSSLPVGLTLTLWNGATIAREKVFPVTEQLTFDGYSGIAAVTLYPGSEIAVPTAVTCNQLPTCVLPAGWYLDGVAIPHYSNPGFQITGEGKSLYHFKATADMTPGTHTLTFVCNPDGLPGAARTEFSTKIELLPKR